MTKSAHRKEADALFYARLVEVEVDMLRALADMPIKYRNVLLPCCQPVLAEAIALATVLKQDSLPCRNIAPRAQSLCDSLAHILEIALRLKALPEGRVAMILERLHKAKKGIP